MSTHNESVEVTPLGNILFWLLGTFLILGTFGYALSTGNPVVVGAFVVLVVLAHFIAEGAVRKGHDYWPWAVYTYALAIIAIPHYLLLAPSNRVSQLCPHCRSRVPNDASVCARCTRDL